MSLSLISAPVDFIVRVAEAKEHLRVTSDDDSAYITGLSAAAGAWLDGRDGILGRALITQTWELALDSFPCGDGCMNVPLPPLQSVNYIKYIDLNGVEQTLSANSYIVDNKSHPARVLPAYGQTWPAARSIQNAVTVRFVAGYGNAAESVPASIVQAAKLLIGQWYDNRAAISSAPNVSELPFAVRALLTPFIVRSF